MADPLINWGTDPNADMVAGYLAAQPKGVDWSKFWNDFLWFGEPPDKLARDVGAGVSQAGQSVNDAILQAEKDAEDAAKKAASQTWRNVAPWLAVGALALVVVEVAKAR